MASARRAVDRSSEGFVRIPFRVIDALRADELTFVQYGVLVFLTDRVWRCHGDPYITRLDTVAADLHWTHSVEYLRQTLVELDENGWIRAVRKPGSKTWSIELRAADIDPSEGKPPTDLQLTSNYPQGSELEVASNSPAPSTALIPLVQADRNPFQPPTHDRSKKRTKREEQTYTPPESIPPFADVDDDCLVCDRRTRHKRSSDGRIVCVECGVLEGEAVA